MGEEVTLESGGGRGAGYYTPAGEGEAALTTQLIFTQLEEGTTKVWSQSGQNGSQSGPKGSKMIPNGQSASLSSTNSKREQQKFGTKVVQKGLKVVQRVQNDPK